MIFNGLNNTGPKSEAVLCELGPSRNLAGCVVIMTERNLFNSSFYNILYSFSYVSSQTTINLPNRTIVSAVSY